MDYSRAIDRLLTLVDHERVSPAAPRQTQIYDLGRMMGFLEHLGNPHLSARTIHVAGTKGKGSTAAFCDSALHAAGYRTGFYSSPHLHSFCERLRRDARPVPPARFASLVDQLWPHQLWLKDNTRLGPVSLFEFMTGMAFQCYRQDQVEFQTIEVGLGGRLDATNVVDPQVCVITPISLDHTAILGDTLAEIAGEKAGIIKPGAPVVIAPQAPEAESVITSVCRERGARPIRVGVDVTWEAGPASMDGQYLTVHGRLGEYQLHIPLLGAYQLENAAAAVAALEVLKEEGYSIPDAAIGKGFADVFWPGRMEVLSQTPLIVADGAHNLHSVAAMTDSLPKYLSYRRLVLIAGFSRDKSVDDMVNHLAKKAVVVYATRSRHPRSLAAGSLGQLFRSQGVADVIETDTVSQALGLALDRTLKGDLLLGAGSLFVAAEVREAVLGIEPELYPNLLPPDLRSPQPAV